MKRDPRFDVLFEPVSIGPKTLRNRFYATPQCSGFGSDRPGAQAYHRAMKAAGGFAIVHTEWCAIHPEADEWPATTGRIWDAEDARNLGLMVAKVHEQGALAGIQLGFNGMHSENLETRIPARGIASFVSDTFPFHGCYEMTVAEIVELEGFYGAAAARALEAGFDVINVCANENAGIPQQFLMPSCNPRTDSYGGSLENRVRFLRETLAVIREVIGDKCALSVRLAIETIGLGESGIRAEVDAGRIIELLDDQVDLWDLEVTGPSMLEWGDSAGPSRFFSEGYQLEWLAKARPHTKKAIVGVGRWVHPEAMARAVRGGAIDLIGIARPGIADPFLPAKIEQGREDEIRECIGCNVCISRYEQKATIVCTQNATIGEEYRRGWHPEHFTPATNRDNDVLVVGAGPAGMECAVVLGRRGMRRVHLVDADRDLGGHLRWVSRLPGLGEWARVIDYRKIQLEKLRNVSFIPGTKLSAEEALDYGAEIVVVASGSSWAGDGRSGFTRAPIPGADAGLPHVLTPEQVLVDGNRPPGETVVIYDCDGYYMAASIAELLAGEGFAVDLVTPFAEPFPYMSYTLEAPRMEKALVASGVEIRPRRLVIEIDAGGVVGRPLRARAATDRSDASGVVLCTQRVADDGLYRQLDADRQALAEADITGLYRIGDCVVPRLVADAVFDGHRLGREIDQPEPAIAAPFIRERRLVAGPDDEAEPVSPEVPDPFGLPA